ncbi:MAG: hypothetical protein HC898_03760 [Phycisphaerales bacterium]|nr:hypothetical protein [Phycisphaerales bacterium]
MLADQPGAMRQLMESMKHAEGGKVVSLLGRQLDISASKRTDINTLAEMAYQVEKASHGYVCPVVREYFAGLADFVEPQTLSLRKAA